MTRLGSSPESINDAAEKRRWPRYHVDVPIRAVVLREGTYKSVRGIANDLSQGGLAAVLPVELVMGERIELEVVLPHSSAALKVQAVIRNRRSYSYGMEFANITASQQATIERTCRSLALFQQEADPGASPADSVG